MAAEVITADGHIVVVNETSGADLFWALRGGGGGTFAVVASLTYRSWPAPEHAGTGAGQVSCPNTAKNQKMLALFLPILRDDLLRPEWSGF